MYDNIVFRTFVKITYCDKAFLIKDYHHHHHHKYHYQHVNISQMANAYRLALKICILVQNASLLLVVTLRDLCE